MLNPITITGIVLVAVGVLGIFWLIVRKIPTLAKLQEFQVLPQASFGERVKQRLAGIKYSTYRPLILDWLEKNLRKLRLLILKIDDLFVGLIKRSRERSQVWQIRSSAWMEHMRLKKKEKLQVLESLDKAEVSAAIQKITAEVAKDEDAALKEKIETVASDNSSVGAGKEETVGSVIDNLEESNKADESDAVVTDEEKKYIDMIAANHKDVKAYSALGFIYLKRKNYSDARACFRRVLKLTPDDAEVKNKLEEIKGLRGKKIANGV